MVALYILADTYAALIALVASVCLPMVLVALNVAAARKVGVVLRCPQTSVKRQEIEGSLHLVNQSMFFCGRILALLTCANSLTGESEQMYLRLSLPGRSTEDVAFFFQSRFCGRVERALASL
jgi:hypothetical protein